MRHAGVAGVVVCAFALAFALAAQADADALAFASSISNCRRIAASSAESTPSAALGNGGSSLLPPTWTSARLESLLGSRFL